MTLEPLTAFTVVAEQDGDHWNLIWRTPTRAGHHTVASIDDVHHVTREVAEVIAMAIGAPTETFDVLLVVDKHHDLAAATAA